MIGLGECCYDLLCQIFLSFDFLRVRGVVLWPVGYMYVPVGTSEPTPLTTAFEVDASQMKLSLAPGVGDRK